MLRTLAPLLLPGSVSLIVAACGAALVAVVTRPRRAGLHRPAMTAAAACGVGSVLLALAFLAIERPATEETKPTRLLPVPGLSASTDRGTAVPIGWPAVDADDEDMPEGLEWRAIAAGAGRAEANCHGWVFADGDYWIPTESVDTILRDNGYEWIAAPGPGDLIVYRDDQGRPIHSGIVKAVGEEGFVLIESKVGPTDVFWHTADDQAFGDEHEFWHSPRAGHTLRMTPHPPAATHRPAPAAK